jgi:hypothetical protein
MDFTFEYLSSAHQHSFGNEKEIMQSNSCGCFYCMKIFPPSEITEWIGDKPFPTALCPYCIIDAVIGDKSGFPITDSEFLTAIHNRFFYQT